jgi:hypothetical protein
MANALYDKGKGNILSGNVDWDTDNIRALLLDADDHTTSLTTDDALDDIPGSSPNARVAVLGSNFSSKTTTDGVADAADITFTSVSGDEAEELVIYKHSGVESTSWLIVNIDTAGGLPITPNGGNIDVTWDDGANKIFAL